MLNFKKFNAVVSAFIFLILPVFLAACSEDEKERVFLSTVQPISSDRPVTVPTSHPEPEADYKADTYIILNNKNTTINGDGASFKNGVLSINKAGAYHLKGSLSGRIEVKAKKGSVRLFLNGISVEGGDNPALSSSLKNGELYLIPMENTSSSFTSRADGDDENDSAVFAAGSITVDGNGSLAVVCRSGVGMYSGENITFKSSSTDIQSQETSVWALKNLKVSGGTLGVSSGGTALLAESDKSEILFEGGKTNISGIERCLKSGSDVSFSGGRHELIVGGGSTDRIATGKSESSFVSDSFSSIPAEYSKDSKVVEAGRNIFFSGGAVYTGSNADAFCASKVISVSGGKLTVQADKTAFSSEKTVSVSGGNTDITFCGRGIKTGSLYFSGGKFSIAAKRRAIKVDKALLQSGGALIALSAGSRDNSAIDYGKICSISAGTLFAAGGTDELKSITGKTASLSLDRKLSGKSTLSVTQNGAAILSCAIPFDCDNAILFSDMLTFGSSYKIYASPADSSESERVVLLETVTAK